jgi:dTDP-glucose 4,6-dehydratase
MQAEVEIESEPVRIRPVKSEVERLLSDNGKAEKLLGWEPEYAGYQGLQKGMAETITWFSQSENLKKYRPGVYNL